MKEQIKVKKAWFWYDVLHENGILNYTKKNEENAFKQNLLSVKKEKKKLLKTIIVKQFTRLPPGEFITVTNNCYLTFFLFLLFGCASSMVDDWCSYIHHPRMDHMCAILSHVACMYRNIRIRDKILWVEK